MVGEGGKEEIEKYELLDVWKKHKESRTLKIITLSKR